MAEFERKMIMLSERGTPVGAADLIERVEAELAGDPLVVVARRKGRLMAIETEKRPDRREPTTRRGLVWAAAVFVAILGIAALAILAWNREPDVVDPPPTTAVTEIPTPATDLALVEQAISAWWSGDEVLVEAFWAVPFHQEMSAAAVDDELAYLQRVDDQVTFECRESEEFIICDLRHTSALSRAVGERTDIERLTYEFQVDDGVIVAAFSEMGYPQWDGGADSMNIYLSSIGITDYRQCATIGERNLVCGELEMQHLDDWAAFYQEASGS